MTEAREDKAQIDVQTVKQIISDIKQEKKLDAQTVKIISDVQQEGLDSRVVKLTNSTKGGGLMKHWHVNWIITIIILLAVCVVIFQLYEIKTNQRNQLARQQETNQFLYSSFNMETQRQRYVLFMRDRIIERWTELKSGKRKVDVNYEKAYRISDITYREFTKYPWMPDPLFLLAIQRTESNFGADTISEMNAKGLYQVMESTAKPICFILGLTFSPNMLFDIDANSRIAVKNLDLLYSSYSSLDLILVGHNGGNQIEYYKKGREADLMRETRLFVPTVLRQWDKYKSDFKNYKIDSLLVNLR